ncbi:hypothetical protein H0E86_01065 [Streptomyces sp. SCSIO-PteL053]|nr:hypothetical protein H0E86_01065 [Streptomyces sp. SCSIO-PteL053]
MGARCGGRLARRARRDRSPPRRGPAHVRLPAPPLLARRGKQAAQHRPRRNRRRSRRRSSGRCRPEDGTFWAAVESEDLEALSRTLAVDTEQSFAAALPALAAWRQQRTALATVDAWRYRVTWQRVSESAGTGALSGTWLVIAPEPDAGCVAEYASGIEQYVQQCVSALAPADVRVVRVGTGHDSETFAARIRTVLADADADAGGGGEPVAVTGILSLLALDTNAHPGADAVPAGFASTLTLVKTLGHVEEKALQKPLHKAPLWIATRGAASVGRTDRVTDPTQALLWGLGGVISAEHTQLWGGLVDLPAELDQRSARRLRRVLVAAGERTSWPYAPPVCTPAGWRTPHRPGLAPDRPGPRRGGPHGHGVDPPRGTVLITGGTRARRPCRPLARRPRLPAPAARQQAGPGGSRRTGAREGTRCQGQQGHSGRLRRGRP